MGKTFQLVSTLVITLCCAAPAFACGTNKETAAVSGFYLAMKDALADNSGSVDFSELVSLLDKMADMKGAEREEMENRVLAYMGAERQQDRPGIPPGHFWYMGKIYKLRC